MEKENVNSFRLLDRDKFREAVFLRDNHTCVICKKPAKDVHHILERRLFLDGGYYLSNGASLCEECHLKAEMTLISVEEIREACGIAEKDKVLPEHLYPDQIYDKWSNPILPNGKRMRGDLFDDISVQKILNEAGLLGVFTKYVKYPRTFHLPFSPGATKDDRIIKDTKHFEGQEVIVNLKYDGENCTFYNDYLHARSLSDKKHWSRTWIKNFHSKIAHDIPEEMRFIVENLYAKHSIKYSNLDNYCYGISAWVGMTCLDWDTTTEWFALLDIPMPEIIYQGIWNEDIIKNLHKPMVNGEEREGFVVRLKRSFHYKDFPRSVAKFVRANHVSQDHFHWFHNTSGEKNEIKEKVI